ncbi:hypothetical protein RHGRI_026168 [Rhododendron griersonianum]|uniref:DUF8040 domain-containing protein n=1 Tax=Rhododendron griersonianum TaxID=479676 RepID=A0AAV6ISR1_9ERIC|nr:hypothetical protein RHGRI_026168 [Rhododendron griersonianum]
MNLTMTMTICLISKHSKCWKSTKKCPQRNAKMSGQDYVTFLLQGHPRTVKDILCVDKHTFRALVKELILRGQLDWDHKKLSIEESLAIFLYICGQSGRHRLAADKFQRSTSTISDHFNWMRRAVCRLAPYIIKPPNLEQTPPEILHDERYFPWFTVSSNLSFSVSVSSTFPCMSLVSVMFG